MRELAALAGLDFFDMEPSVKLPGRIGNLSSWRMMHPQSVDTRLDLHQIEKVKEKLLIAVG
jgi:hypothetical protein